MKIEDFHSLNQLNLSLLEENQSNDVLNPYDHYEDFFKKISKINDFYGTQVFYKEKDISLNVYGLRPLTRYYLYVNRIQNVSRTKQKGKKLSEPLISDKNGSIELLYYIDSTISSDSPKSSSVKKSILQASPLDIVLTTLNQTTLAQDFENISTTYAKTVIY